VLANNDQVVAFLPMPPGSRLNNVWLDVSVLTDASMDIFSSCMYGLSGFVVDVDDPDTTWTYDTVWDRMITKDVAEGFDILQLDTATASNDPEFEPGKIDLFQVFGDNLVGNMQIYQKREMLTFAKKPITYDPSNDSFFPSDAFKVHVARGPKVSRPSVAMFGFSAPAADQTQAFTLDALGQTPGEKEWLITMYSEVFLYDMWKHLIGITPGASVDPFNDVSAWFAKLMEDKMYESYTGLIIPANFRVHCKATWDMSVVGKPGKVTLTSD
jgi:hypothetical protein